jgi:hypothetical protein
MPFTLSRAACCRAVSIAVMLRGAQVLTSEGHAVIRMVSSDDTGTTDTGTHGHRHHTANGCAEISPRIVPEKSRDPDARVCLTATCLGPRPAIGVAVRSQR